MANVVTKPILLDETGQAIVTQLQRIAQSGGGGGHTIVDNSGNEMTQRSKLQFQNSTVTDDSTNGKTVVKPNNIQTTTTDPGEGSTLATNCLLFVIEE